MRKFFQYIPILGVLFLALYSCSTEFSKYEKSGLTDVERSGLKDKVKEVKSYWNGRLSKIEKYNKFGFLEEVQDYNYGELRLTTKYQYDDFGNLINTVENYEDGRTYNYASAYDDHNHIIKTTCTSTENGVTGKNKFIASYENFYDNGVLVKRIIRDSESTPNGNYSIEHYNFGGKLIREQKVNESGEIEEFVSYEYYANGSLYRTNFLYPNGLVFNYCEEIYEPNSTGNYKEPRQRVFIYPESPNNYVEQNYKYNDNRDCVYFECLGEGYNAEYKYDKRGNWIYRKEIPFTETSYDDGNGGSQGFLEEKREIKYY